MQNDKNKFERWAPAFWNALEVCRALGSEDKPLPKSSLYFQVAEQKTLTTAVKFGARRALWPRAEIEAIIKARVAGADNEAIRKLVTELHAARKVGCDMSSYKKASTVPGVGPEDSERK